MVEVPNRLSLSALKQLRREFGTGVAGKIAFRMIATGADCEGLESDGNKCPNRAIATIDFDAPRVNALVQIPTCNDCAGRIQEKVFRECFTQGSAPSFGINGRGRS